MSTAKALSQELDIGFIVFLIEKGLMLIYWTQGPVFRGLMSRIGHKAKCISGFSLIKNKNHAVLQNVQQWILLYQLDRLA